MSRRVVITSIGVVSSLGSSAAEIIGTLRGGHVKMVRPDFDRDVAICPVGGHFDVKAFTGRYKNARYLNRGAQFCVASAAAAVKQADLAPDALSRAGLFLGVGPNLDIGSELPEIHEGKIGQETLPALWILRFLPNTAASSISELFGIHGENATICTACSASLQAMGEAFGKIKEGRLDLALAGGGDSRLGPGAILAYRKARALWMGAGDPSKLYAPFDMGRKGFVPGEGGAVFLLEELEHAKMRDAHIHGEIVGYGASMDGFNMTAPRPDGKWGEMAVRSALNESGLAPARIDVVSAHGTGTPLNDDMESSLIARLFGDHKPYVIALKSWIGHLASGCGAVELAIALACMEHRCLPEIRNLGEPCAKGINFVREATSIETESLLIQNFGFGGQNSALVMRAWKE
jgi:3-oxoacyl-[acyl-carrier-protein] synthase II